MTLSNSANFKEAGSQFVVLGSSSVAGSALDFIRHLETASVQTSHFRVAIGKRNTREESDDGHGGVGNLC